MLTTLITVFPMISRLTNTNIVDVVMVTVTEMTWRTGASYEEIYNIRNKIAYNVINDYFNRSMKSGSHLLRPYVYTCLKPEPALSTLFIK